MTRERTSTPARAVQRKLDLIRPTSHEAAQTISGRGTRTVQLLQGRSS